MPVAPIGSLEDTRRVEWPRRLEDDKGSAVAAARCFGLTATWTICLRKNRGGPNSMRKQWRSLGPTQDKSASLFKPATVHRMGQRRLARCEVHDLHLRCRDKKQLREKMVLALGK